MTIAIQTQFAVRQSTIEMEGEEIRCGDLREMRYAPLSHGGVVQHICITSWHMRTGVEWAGSKHAQVNIPCVTIEALLGRYHQCVDGIGHWLLCFVQNLSSK